MSSPEHQRVPEEGEHPEGDTGTPRKVDIQGEQPHPERKNRQCSRALH